MDRFRITEGSSLVINVAIEDENGDAVPVASLTAATLTLYDWDTGALGTSPHEGIINDRDEQDVLNANNVTITNGSAVWAVQPEDNIIVTDRRQVERHRAQFVFTWDTGQATYECEIDVENLRLTA